MKTNRLASFLYYLANCFLVVVLFVAFSPLFLLACFLVKLDSRGALFYTQERYSKDKKIFKIYKFRSMKEGAEKNNFPIWGNENDCRSSKIGRFLRVSHIDEFPQLFNILKGEMSFVGPRPERPYFAEKFKSSIQNYEDRYKVKAGITGWSQINGWRGNSSVAKRTEFDIFYIKNRSLLFDLKIFLMTPFAKPVVSPEENFYKKESYILTFSQFGDKVFRENKLLKVPIANA